MIIKRYIKLALIIMILAAILLTGGSYVYRSHQTYSCSGQQKIYLNANEFMDVRIKINVQIEKISMTAKGFFHQADGSISKIYRQGTYQYTSFNNKLYEGKLLSAQRLFADKSPDRLNNNIFGIQPGESRNFRIAKLRDGLMMFGSEYAWFYACRLDS